MAKSAARKVRLDAVLVERGLSVSRAKAQAAVLAGEVYVNGIRASKPGVSVAADAGVEIRPRRSAFVSRGGVKLAHALDTFGLDVHGRVALDAGASAGGFTDCLLQRGAAIVYAVDVGTGQLAWALRNDPRVVSLEQQDARTLGPHAIPAPVDLATVDVSFISLFTVLPAVMRLVREGGPIVALLKPQFEVGPKAAKGGVVRDPAVHASALAAALHRAGALGLTVRGVTPSPIAGPEGNLEFFLLMDTAPGPAPSIDVRAVIAAAHARVLRRSAATEEQTR